MTKNNKVNTAIAIVSGVSALLGIFIYFDNKKHRKLQSEILEIDKEIKEIQLNQIRR
jgi:hypothetical protein